MHLKGELPWTEQWLHIRATEPQHIALAADHLANHTAILMPCLDRTNYVKVNTIEGIHNNFFYFEITNTNQVKFYLRSKSGAQATTYQLLDTTTNDDKLHVAHVPR